MAFSLIPQLQVHSNYQDSAEPNILINLIGFVQLPIYHPENLTV